MPIPDLNEFGVLPPGLHDCTLEEVPAIYATNAHRKALWAQFLDFISWLDGKPVPQALLIDGGFTSDKSNPKDIDVVLDCLGADDVAQNYWAGVFFTQRSKIQEDFRVDFWVKGQSFQNDLSEFFTYVRPEEALRRGMGPLDRKGMLRIIP